MPKKGSLNWWKKKAWEQFSKYVRIRDALRTTGDIRQLVCCSCGKLYPAFGVGCAQGGHFIPGRGNSVLFEEHGVHGQCYNCNMRMNGNWVGYYRFMLKQYGQEEIDRLMFQSRQPRKYTAFDLEELRDEYKRLYGLMLETRELHLFGEDE
jgi:hypothetical protein